MQLSSSRDAVILTSSTLPVLSWDGRTPTTLIGQVEARLAVGARFAVLANTTPLGRAADRGFLEGWWRAAHPRLGSLCAGWAVLVAGADVNPGLLLGADTVADFAAFPIRNCADRADALWWLRTRLAKADSAPSILQ